ncbi:sulfite exporter TauE/SafE family protein [Stieleria varia]|uniref:Probable membrane transporter protein n=1 Tax=Stieleria varia TaxID=2528005 RepID=A0A5C6AZ20_9BACT|nr:sulfite exporter TauE/SafE family protein [Stieleria varia]TWU04399.1 Sulfite exporter TauE/SafE [Stieleria varia]
MEPFWVIVSICAIALAAGFIHSAIGFGFGIVAVTLMPLVIDARQAHVLISLASVPVLIGTVWTYREGADYRSLLKALAGAAIGLPLGVLAFERMSMDYLVRGTGVAILVMVWMSFRNRRLAQQRSDCHASGGQSLGGHAALAGAYGGFLAGAVSIAAPPVAAWALQQSWEQKRFKAFLNQFLLAVSIYKVAALLVRDLVDREVCYQALWLAPLAIIGIRVGAYFSGRLSAGWFQVVVAVALVGIAVLFVLRGEG